MQHKNSKTAFYTCEPVYNTQINMHEPVHMAPSGRSALHWAAYYKKIDAVKQLISGGADVYEKDAMGRVALDYLNDSEREEVIIHIEAIKSQDQLLADAMPKATIAPSGFIALSTTALNSAIPTPKETNVDVEKLLGQLNIGNKDSGPKKIKKRGCSHLDAEVRDEEYDNSKKGRF